MTVFVNKGDAPLTPVQLQRRTQKYVNRAVPAWARERALRKGGQHLAQLNAVMAGFETDDDINIANNTFNWQLSEYRKATIRLEKYRLADGRAEQAFEEPSGEYDDEGNEIMHTWIIAAIDPLPAQVEETTYDDEGNATTAMVDNPEIVHDDAERAAAQAVVDGTPDEVKAHASTNITQR